MMSTYIKKAHRSKCGLLWGVYVSSVYSLDLLRVHVARAERLCATGFV